jgi:hypothetical protein
MRLRAVKSFYHNRLGIVTLEDDVLSVVSQVYELTDGKVSVNLDPQTGWFHLVEACDDGTDRLVFSVSELDGRVVKRLQMADSHSHRHTDPYDAEEREQDALWKRQEEAAREKINEAGEELAYQLRRGGITPRMPLPVSIPKDIHADH